jgi:predicted O-methyltransferase YrrM
MVGASDAERGPAVPGNRRIAVAGGAIALVVVAVIVLVRTLQGLTDVSVLLLVGLVEVLLALVAYAVLLLRRSSAATRRALSRVQGLAGAVDETRAATRRLDRTLTRTAERVRRLDDADVRLRRSRADYVQVEALLELRALAGADAIGLPMPALRGWAASPSTLLTAVRAVLDLRPDLVVECGSGSSSVWIGHVLRRLGHGRYVALEHDAAYAEVSRAEVARHGLADLVEVRHAPLVPVTVDGAEQPWYDPAAFADLDGIGVVFVDGPPNATGPMARVPAVPLLGPRCVRGAVVVLDDAARPEERAVVDHWVAGGATLVDRRPWEKGVAVLRLDSPRGETTDPPAAGADRSATGALDG